MRKGYFYWAIKYNDILLIFIIFTYELNISRITFHIKNDSIFQECYIYLIPSNTYIKN